MADKTTLKLYVVVDDDGDHAVSNYDMDNAESLYNDEFSGTIVARYEIDFIIPTPRAKTVRVEITAPDDHRPIPETFANVRVLPPGDDY